MTDYTEVFQNFVEVYSEIIGVTQYIQILNTGPIHSTDVVSNRPYGLPKSFYCILIAVNIPIPKPGKDHSNTINYRPISLTSCLFKVFERLFNNRVI